MNCDYRQMLNDTEEMVCSIAEALDTPNTISYRNSVIDLTMPWPRITVKDAFLQYAGWDPTVCEDLSTFDIDLVTRVMPSFPSDRPVILADYPASMASLAKISTMNPLVAERAEVFIGGMEIANAYSELADARQQRLRFEHEIKQIQKERNLTYTMPEAFLDALYNFPPSGGIALGIDRLVMLFCNADTIDDVIAFPDA
jgi:lysyl-tRNA synthetase class 2